MTTTAMEPPAAPLAGLTMERVLTATAALMAACGVAFLAAGAMDDRSLGGENVWTKPLRFAVALAVYAATLAFYARWLPERFKASPAARFFVLAGAVAIVAEMIWVGGAAWLGVTSHFNQSMAGQILYGLMGVLAILLTSLSLVWGVAILRRNGAASRPPMRLAIGIGLVLTFLLTLVTAGTMAAVGPHPAGLPTGAGTVPFLGWSTSGGDLKVAHFLATHALHAIPLAALPAVSRRARAGRRAVLAAAAAYAALVLFTFGQALAGRPFLAV